MSTRMPERVVSRDDMMRFCEGACALLGGSASWREGLGEVTVRLRGVSPWAADVFESLLRDAMPAAVALRVELGSFADRGPYR